MRTAYDFSPLYRSTVGFDKMLNLLDSAARAETESNWPPYDIERKSENEYRINLAIAGFGAEDVELTQHGNSLIVTGQKRNEPDGRQILHRGIASRNFKHTFSLADYVKVVSAGLENGVLSVDLVREVPEQLRPRQIKILTADSGAAAQDNSPKQVGEGPASQRKAA